VARVMVGAQNAVLGLTLGHTALELLEAALVDCAERLDLHRSHSFSSSLWLPRHRADSNRRSALCRRAPEPLGPGVQAPPRGVEPLPPGSKPGALPLSYGGGGEGPRRALVRAAHRSQW